MKRQRFTYAILTLAVVLLTSATSPPGKIRIHLIGDSTIAAKNVSAFPETGWGMPFSYFFDSTVVVCNHARNGRSTRTFLSEKRWKNVTDSLQGGDYVFIQFGHNDESKEKIDRYTTPEEYSRNLKRFIKETRNVGATPVLLTPASRRKFDEHGKAQETHAEYSALVREVAAAEKVLFIDLDAKSRELLQQFGDDKSKLLFLHLQPGEHPNYPQGKTDNTHFSELGARLVAQIVLKEVILLDSNLASRVRKPVPKP
jgi:lysophospholipase L1-like esterase